MKRPGSHFLAGLLPLQPDFRPGVGGRLHSVHAGRQVFAKGPAKLLLLAGLDDRCQGAQGDGNLAIGAVDHYQALGRCYLNAAWGRGYPERSLPRRYRPQLPCRCRPPARRRQALPGRARRAGWTVWLARGWGRRAVLVGVAGGWVAAGRLAGVAVTQAASSKAVRKSNTKSPQNSKIRLINSLHGDHLHRSRNILVVRAQHKVDIRL